MTKGISIVDEFATFCHDTDACVDKHVIGSLNQYIGIRSLGIQHFLSDTQMYFVLFCCGSIISSKLIHEMTLTIFVGLLHCYDLNPPAKVILKNKDNIDQYQTAINVRKHELCAWILGWTAH